MSILLLESLHPDAEALLSSVDVLVRAADPNRPEVDFAKVRAILTRGRGRIEATLIKKCPALAVIARAGAGLDNLDTREAAKLKIPVIFAPGASASTVAEHTLALMLDLSRGITKSAVQVRAGCWEDRKDYQGEELRGLTLGIVGFGNIGRRVAQLAEAFSMKILIATNPESKSTPDPKYTYLPLDEVLAAADIVTLHLPLTESTNGLLDAGRLQQMKRGALLINTSRGALIDMAALQVALESRHIGGFAADVLDVEPPDASNPLLKQENVILTPHVASLTSATYRKICIFTAENVVKVLNGEEPVTRSIYR